MNLDKCYESVAVSLLLNDPLIFIVRKILDCTITAIGAIAAITYNYIAANRSIFTSTINIASRMFSLFLHSQSNSVTQTNYATKIGAYMIDSSFPKI